MIYTKIRLDFKYGPKERFYRTVLVKNDINLFDLCIGFCLILRAEFEHCFLITERNNNKEYVMAPFMESPLPGYKYLGNYSLKDLADTFSFEYDTGEGWDFLCKKYKKEVSLNSKKEFIIIDGAGMGIFEDNISSLYALLNDKIDSLSGESDEEHGYYLPWNLPITKYGEFDEPLDIDELNDMLADEYKETIKKVLENEKQYIKENNVNTNDFEGNYRI